MHELVSLADGRRVFWKLDPHQNASRMRFKLQIDYQGSDHKEAVHATHVSKSTASKDKAAAAAAAEKEV